MPPATPSGEILYRRRKPKVVGSGTGGETDRVSDTGTRASTISIAAITNRVLCIGLPRANSVWPTAMAA